MVLFLQSGFLLILLGLELRQVGCDGQELLQIRNWELTVVPLSCSFVLVTGLEKQ